MFAFSWNDGVNSYETNMLVPNIKEGFNADVTVKHCLNGNVLVITKVNSEGKARKLSPFTLTWDVADEEFLPIAEESWNNARVVSVFLPLIITSDAELRWTTVEKQVKVITFNPEYIEGRLTSLEMTLQEIA
jgi:hypothetical protein